ncbi:MAG: hypothetical protein D4Q79_01225 [Spirochaetia bacterium]|nr:MAG: hypothetical protein D4Q79_01225 [Spirochaetia bacterium]
MKSGETTRLRRILRSQQTSKDAKCGRRRDNGLASIRTIFDEVAFSLAGERRSPKLSAHKTAGRAADNGVNSARQTELTHYKFFALYHSSTSTGHHAV